ncbi:MAG: type II toxin-antitoxin system HicB family antitoxin [Prosthecobacter sp.]|nr:type II toxin-antitoxin system HicB family antitoxin [Prosthecobacter sp.]
MKAIPYQITVSYSADDEGYVARVPALRYCLAFGETPEKAVKEVKTAAAAMLKVMEEDGKPLPAVDTTLARITALQPLLNLSAIAKAADISVQTLSSKISRGTAFSADESARIGRVLAAHGVSAA